jgi:hypothetical protein
MCLMMRVSMLEPYSCGLKTLNNQITGPRSYHFKLHILYFIENYIYDDSECFTQYFLYFEILQFENNVIT